MYVAIDRTTLGRFGGGGLASSSRLSPRRTSGPASQQRLFGLFVASMCRLTRERVVMGEDVADFMVAWLKRRGVKVLAVDFDQTITRRHSGGCVDREARSTHRLWRSLSPDMNALGVAAANADMPIVCVTFSDEGMKSLLCGPKQDPERLLAGEGLIQTFMEMSGAAFRISRVYPFYPR